MDCHQNPHQKHMFFVFHHPVERERKRGKEGGREGGREEREREGRGRGREEGRGGGEWGREEERDKIISKNTIYQAIQPIPSAVLVPSRTLSFLIFIFSLKTNDINILHK